MREHSYFVYILRCADGSYYTGITNNVERRLGEHEAGHPGSYTYTRRPFQLVYTEHFRYVLDAIAWEKHVKRWSRAKKEALIAGDWEKLPILARSAYAKRIHAMVVVVRRAHHDNFQSPYDNFQAHHDNLSLRQLSGSL